MLGYLLRLENVDGFTIITQQSSMSQVNVSSSVVFSASNIPIALLYL